MGDIHDKIVTT